MSLLNEFENEQQLLNELKDLFEFAPPALLRRSIEDVFFNLIATEDELGVSKKIAQHIYLLINFLNEAEQHVNKPH
ncbi:hypothetical protein [Ekhidna sp. To15]|uniref:hypothetical protein n=1 Tax=Ekhidna sp. To15 TaxID=3395267 RepID=UPI003F524835